MLFELSAEQILLRQSTRRFVTERIVPNARSWDRSETFPHEIVAEAAALGLLGICIPSRYDGSGFGSVETAVVVEELAAGDGSVALTVASHNGLCAGHILVAGDDEQKQRYLPGLAVGRTLGAWALTEPNSGSDAAAMQTTAKRHGHGWLLNGSKIFITQGTVGHLYVVLALTDASLGTGGISAFLVPHDAPGFARAPLKEKLGMRGSDTAVLTFDDVVLPAQAQLGRLGHGFKDTLRVLDRGRITIAALSVGLGRAAFDAAKKYAAVRSQFGRRIADQQIIQFKLADMATQLAAARMMTHAAAARCDAGLSFSYEASMAKLFASEAAVKICDEALQIHGGYGYTSEYPVERYLRDARLCTIGEGTSEIQRLVIARHVLRDLG